LVGKVWAMSSCPIVKRSSRKIVKYFIVDQFINYRFIVMEIQIEQGAYFGSTL